MKYESNRNRFIPRASAVMRHWAVILFACLANTLCFSGTVRAEAPFDPERLEKQTVVAACNDPMQMVVDEDGRLIFIERAGAIRLVRDSSRKSSPVIPLGQLPVAVYGEVGLLGIALDRSFNETGWVYLFFCPQSQPDSLRLSRFTISQEQLELGSEVPMLQYPIDTAGAAHMGGGLWMDDRGDLWIGTGDNCPPIPELPVDFRPGQENFDAFRSSANTQDLRGKILRIHPEPDGSYTIPDDNLFKDSAKGKPEIFAMGCRNPFRFTVDTATGAVLWGDVGPNIDDSLELGPNGYDEFNRATEAGNFGWPMFVGPNEVYRNFDFATRQAGEAFDLNQPVNPSPNNTGIERLPDPQPAVIWYPSTQSDLFPTLGSGGRSAMSGPVYRFSPADPEGPHLPDHFQGRWFIFDWTRNWIQSVQLDASGNVLDIVPFLPETLFRKPIDMKVGTDGSLFVIEYGDKWGDNQDSQISRIVYHRGNRPPTARLSASTLAGREPLHIQLDASRSMDPDEDQLSFQWQLNEEALNSTSDLLEITLDQPGSHRVRLTVSDPYGASDSSEVTIQVGNEPPQVAIQSPLHGSFFDWGDTIHYRVEVDDLEDGSTRTGEIPSARVITSHEMLTRRGRDALVDPGLALMRKTTCFSCHTTKSASAGPSYEAVARKYHGASQESQLKLAGKILSGGAGVWSDKPMPPNPQHTLEEAQQMVRWILSLANDSSSAPQPGKHGFFRTAMPTGTEPSAIQIVAEYTDDGVEVDSAGVEPSPNDDAASGGPTIPALRGEDSIVLHSKRKRAAFADQLSAAKTVDVFEGGIGLVARLAPQGWIALEELRLEEIDRISIQLNHVGPGQGRLVLREDSPDGRELAALALPTTAVEKPSTEYRSYSVAVSPQSGLTDLYLVHESSESEAGSTESSVSSELNISWIEFHDSAETQQRRKEAQAEVRRVLLIPTELDHAWGTHMYTDVCSLLAATLNLTPGVEAIVSPDLDWPKDESLLEDIDALVYYSRPAGDILLSPRHRAQAEKLLERGVGFTAIHWSTGAELEIGSDYEAILGGWFNFEFSGLTVEKQPLEQLDPNHPICRGWDGFLLRDEFYLNLRFHPDAIPLLKVHVDGQDQTVGWVHHRQDGGRSFGTTLGHFHDNFADPRFRRMLVNGILWSAGLEIPESGLPVEIPDDLLQLEQPKATQETQDWSYQHLRAALLQLQSRSEVPPSFENGKELFQKASCASCHGIGTPQSQIAGFGEGSAKSTLGPDLTNIRVEMAKEQDPTGALLLAIVEPSETISDQYRSEIFQLEDGSIVSGLVKSEQDGVLLLADNPFEPEQLRTIELDEIEARRKSDVSWMPAGLLNSLSETEVLDLLTYVEAGGNPNYFAYRPVPVPLESWADSSLPVSSGLRLWLDAARLNQGRSAMDLPELGDGGAVGLWPDASGYQMNAGQRRLESQPLFRTTPSGNWLKFDGIDDHLTANANQLRTHSFTAMMVVAPDHNRGWPGLLSANALGKDDYRSGFNIDLMPEPTESWQAIMSEGPGYQGVVNLMKEEHPWGQFLIVTLRSQPGSDGLVLRVNGRPQGSLDRPSEWLQIDELTVGARYWSHDPALPAFNRGFLSGKVAQVLLFDRPLADEEMVANEVYLWNSNEMLLDPSR